MFRNHFSPGQGHSASRVDPGNTEHKTGIHPHIYTMSIANLLACFGKLGANRRTQRKSFSLDRNPELKIERWSFKTAMLPVRPLCISFNNSYLGICTFQFIYAFFCTCTIHRQVNLGFKTLHCPTELVYTSCDHSCICIVLYLHTSIR